MPDYGIGILSGILGGLGSGAERGFNAGIGDQQKAAEMALQQQKLAEQQRQFDLGAFTDVSPELGAALGIPAGRHRNTILPAAISAGQKEAARREADTQNQIGAAALEKAAQSFGTPEMANPEAAGTEAPSSSVVTPGQPDPYLKMIAGLQRAGVKTENPLIQQWMKAQPGMNPAQQGFFAPKVVTDADGNTIVMQVPKATGTVSQIQTPGITQPLSRGQTYTAMDHYATTVLGLTRGSKEYADFMGRAVPQPTPVGSDLPVFSRPDIVAGGKGGATPPPVGNTNYNQFLADQKRMNPGVTQDQIDQQWASLTGPGKATVELKPGQSQQSSEQGVEVGFKGPYKGKYEVFDPPPVQTPAGALAYRPARAPEQAVEKIRDQEFAVNSMRSIADAIDNMSMDDRARLRAALKMGIPGALEKIPGIGGLLSRATQTSEKLALTPEQAAIQTHIGHSQLRYENAMAGVRGASSTTLYPVFQQIMGNLGDINAPTKLRQLANDLQQAALIGQRDMVASRYQGIPLHFRPEVDSSNPAKKEGGSPFEQWKRSQGVK